MRLEAGDRLGDWVIVRPLGAGGMGSVYKAHSVLAEDVLAAVKVLEPSDVGDFERRFVQEMRTLSALAHPAIVQVKGGGRDEQRGLVYMAMELVDGEDLSHVLRRGALSVPEALRVFVPVAEALRYAHDKGVAHRDIKPANIMLRRDGSPVIVDFGIAVAAGHTRLTREGMVPGTVTYLPPEVFQGEAPVPRASDAYALGVVMWEAITGDEAFAPAPDSSESESLVQVMGKKLRGEALDPGDQAPEPLRQAIRRTTDPEPDTRLVDLAEVRALLGQATGEQVLVRGAPRKRRRWPWVLAALLLGGLALALVLLVLVVGVGTAGVAWYSASPTPAPPRVVDLQATLEQGAFALEQGDLELAHLQASAALDSHPEDPHANLLYGQALALGGQPELARPYLCAAVDGGLSDQAPPGLDCQRGPGAQTPLTPALVVAQVDLGELYAPAVADAKVADRSPPAPPSVAAPSTGSPAPAPSVAPGGPVEAVAVAAVEEPEEAAPVEASGGAMAKPSSSPKRTSSTSASSSVRPTGSEGLRIKLQGSPVVEGPLSVRDVQDALERHLRALQYCADIRATPAREVTIVLSIEATGAVSEVEVRGASEALTPCLVSRLRRLLFPSAEGPSTVTWTLRLE